MQLLPKHLPVRGGWVFNERERYVGAANQEAIFLGEGARELAVKIHFAAGVEAMRADEDGARLRQHDRPKG